MDIVQAQLIRDLEADRLYERQLARRWIAVGVVAVAISLVIYIIILGKHSYKDPEGTVLVFLLTLFVIGNAGIVMNAYRLYEAYKLALPEMPEPDPEPDPSDELMFNLERDGPEVRLEDREDNTVILSDIRLRQVQWYALVRELHDNSPVGPIAWSRAKMENVKDENGPNYMPRIVSTHYSLFIGLNSRNEKGETKFKALTKKLRDFRIVSGADGQTIVTDYGWTELCRAAGLDVVL